jgi:hypothetical protein
MKKSLALIFAVLMLLPLCACGEASTDTLALEPEAAAADVAYDMDYTVSSASLANGYSREAAAVEESETESEAPEENPDKIIYSADVNLETTEFEDTLEKISALVDEYCGWIESSSISGANYYSISRGNTYNRNATYTIRIPSDDFDTVMSGISALGNVPYSHIYTENVTTQYYDTQARIDSYKAQEESLLKLMEKAESVEDIITIESKLADVRYSIESLQTTINNWDRKVSYSTVYLSVDEVSEYTPQAVVTKTFGEKLVQALKNGFRFAGEFLSDLVLWLVEALPTIVLAAAIIFGIFAAVRPAIKKRRAKRAERKAQKEQKENNKGV